jgi:DNA-binding transcriptional regulator YbjK
MTARATRPRGLHRRGVIVAAAREVLIRDGLTGLSHRAVAAEAGVPLGSTTYYFSGRDDLARAALDDALARERDRRAWLARRPAPGPGDWVGLADRLVALLLPPDVLAAGTAAAFYQRWTEASGHPALVDLLAADLDDLRGHLEPLLAAAGLPVPERTVLALGDGRVVHWLVEGGGPEVLVARLAEDLAACAGAAAGRA